MNWQVPKSRLVTCELASFADVLPISSILDSLQDAFAYGTKQQNDIRMIRRSSCMG